FGFDIDSENEFEGEGKSNQSNKLSGSISVTVSAVLPNGNLLVQGEKWIQINQGSEFIRLKGIVRPADISANNTVQSTQIADAKISYGGKGALADANVSGWMVRFFMSPLWPF
ncbi:MAG: flagellar basal body L-ring protein FlgH, partial [Flavobacteriales bacterium]|nr:flagellar basal body L-ring protein FlgH [Flavobacteriales bacterium]